VLRHFLAQSLGHGLALRRRRDLRALGILLGLPALEAVLHFGFLGLFFLDGIDGLVRGLLVGLARFVFGLARLGFRFARGLVGFRIRFGPRICDLLGRLGCLALGDRRRLSGLRISRYGQEQRRQREQCGASILGSSDHETLLVEGSIMPLRLQPAQCG
jgi:hypothetical protein